MSAGHRSRFLYRGQPFKCEGIYFPNVWFEINLLSGNAGKWLSANRDELAPKAADEIEAVALSALTQVVEADMARYHSTTSEKPDYWPELSLFLHTMALDTDAPWPQLAAQSGDAWMEVSVMGTSIKDCFTRSDWLLGTGADASSGPVDHCDVSTGATVSDSVPTLALRAWEKEKGGSVQILAIDELHHAMANKDGATRLETGLEHPMSETRRMDPVLKFSLERQAPYSDRAFALHLVHAARGLGNRRCLVAINDSRWQGLALKKDFKLPASWLIRPCASAPSVMLLPFLFTGGHALATPTQLTRLCTRMQPLLATALMIDDVRQLYENFIEYLDRDFMPSTPYAGRWQQARGGP